MVETSLIIRGNSQRNKELGEALQKCGRDDRTAA